MPLSTPRPRQVRITGVGLPAADHSRYGVAGALDALDRCTLGDRHAHPHKPLVQCAGHRSRIDVALLGEEQAPRDRVGEQGLVIANVVALEHGRLETVALDEVEVRQVMVEIRAPGEGHEEALGVQFEIHASGAVVVERLD